MNVVWWYRELINTTTIVFENVNDINLTHVFECGQCFRWNREPDDSYIGVVSGFVCRAILEAEEKGQNLVLQVTGGDRAFWGNYFDLDTDYSSIKKSIAANEPLIAAAEEYGYGIRILNQDLYETLMSFIVSQNNNIPRIKKCIEAICERFGRSLGEVFGREWYAFPDAEVMAKLEVSRLMELKLGYRSSYLIEASRKFLAEGAPGSYEEVIAYLGIGPKVANCIRLFGLHEVDAFPVDTWVKHIMNDMYGFEEKDIKGMSEFASRKFGEYAGYAQQYLFYYYRDRS